MTISAHFAVFHEAFIFHLRPSLEYNLLTQPLHSGFVWFLFSYGLISCPFLCNSLIIFASCSESFTSPSFVFPCWFYSLKQLSSKPIHHQVPSTRLHFSEASWQFLNFHCSRFHRVQRHIFRTAPLLSWIF